MLIKVCPKSGERQSKNDFLLIFFYIQSKGAAQSSIFANDFATASLFL